jgi:cytochrome d ubiquinol oxidase subunit II
MTGLEYTMPVIWALLIGTAVALYIVLDGFDLGLGILGGLIQGITVVDGHFAGGAFDWLTPFTLMCGLGVVAGYALLGATWLMMKTEGPVEVRARRLTPRLLALLMLFVAVVSLWTPLAIERIAERWFTLPNLLYLAPVPITTLLLAWVCWRATLSGRTVQPFLAAVGIFMLAYAGLVISNAPWLVPPTLTIWDTAAYVGSQVFMLIGTTLLLPMVLGHTVFVFWVFRGKLKPGEGYH